MQLLVGNISADEVRTQPCESLGNIIYKLPIKPTSIPTRPINNLIHMLIYSYFFFRYLKPNTCKYSVALDKDLPT